MVMLRMRMMKREENEDHLFLSLRPVSFIRQSVVAIVVPFSHDTETIHLARCDGVFPQILHVLSKA